VGEINKTITVALSGQQSVTVTGQADVSLSGTQNIKWIDGTTEPTAPIGFTRLIDLDLDIPIKILDTTVTVKLWAFKQQ
jgi:hypothetical protein